MHEYCDTIHNVHPDIIWAGPNNVNNIGGKLCLNGHVNVAWMVLYKLMNNNLMTI